MSEVPLYHEPSTIILECTQCTIPECTQWLGSQFSSALGVLLQCSQVRSVAFIVNYILECTQPAVRAASAGTGVPRS